MNNEDYRATGINAFDNLADLLETCKHAIQTLINIVDGSQHKVTAYGALKEVRLVYDKAVLDELQKIIDSHKEIGLLEKSEQSKPTMTVEQRLLLKNFHNALCDLEAHLANYLQEHGRDDYADVLNNVRVLGFKISAEWKNQFEE